MPAAGRHEVPPGGAGDAVGRCRQYLLDVGRPFRRHVPAVRSDAGPVFQANYATALLLDGNAEGFWGILDRTHPAVAKLDESVRRWKAGMTFWQRMASALGVGGPRLTPAFPPGDL
jgi:hypothetical protein